MQLILLSAAVAFCLSLALIPAIISAASSQGLLDRPDLKRRRHPIAVPRLGGIAVMAALAAGLVVAGLLIYWLPAVANERQQETLSLVLASGGLVFFIGLWDDLWGLAPRAKLLLTALVAVGLYFAGFRIESIGFPYSRAISLGWFAFPVTVFWVTGMTHAMNLIDGLDGLAAGVAIIALAAAAVAAGLLDQHAVLLASSVLGMAMIGFLLFNRHPARIFLGDCGSLALGTMLAVLTVRSAESTPGSVFILVPLLALAYPLLDTSLSILRRWLRGVSFSAGDRRHVHHQLLSLGPSYDWAVGTLYVCAAGLASLGLLVTFAPRSLVSVISVVGGSVFVMLMVASVRWLGYHEVVEAAQSIASALRNGRRVVQDKIYARDVCELIDSAGSVPAVEAILTESAREFGFLHIQLYRDVIGAPASPLPLDAEQKAQAWRLEYPIVPWATEPEADAFVLRIWCDMLMGSRPYGAERAARLLAPTLEARLASLAPRKAVALRRTSDIPLPRPHQSPPLHPVAYASHEGERRFAEHAD